MLLFYSHKNAIVFRAHGKSSITVGLHFTVPPPLSTDLPTYLRNELFIIKLLICLLFIWPLQSYFTSRPALIFKLQFARISVVSILKTALMGI